LRISGEECYFCSLVVGLVSSPIVGVGDNPDYLYLREVIGLVSSPIVGVGDNPDYLYLREVIGFVSNPIYTVGAAMISYNPPLVPPFNRREDGRALDSRFRGNDTLQTLRES
jgi:hypothetical protein